MKITAADIQNNAQLFNDVISALRDGNVSSYPTDTIYGLGCDAFNAAAVDKLYQLKRRKRNQPLSVICADLMDIHKHATIPGFAYQLMRNLLPGPYTFILPRKNPKLKVLLGDVTNVAVRVPDHALCLNLVKSLGSPIVTTSANISSEEPLETAEQIETTFSPHLAYIIDQGLIASEASSVIDLTHDVPRVLREGRGDVSMFL